MSTNRFVRSDREYEIVEKKNFATLHGEIICRNFNEKKSYLRFIRKQIEKWIQNNKRVLSKSLETTYQVVLEGHASGKLIGCHLRMKVGNTFLMTSQYAQGVQKAFQMCLEHLERQRHAHVNGAVYGRTVLHSP